MMTSERGYYVRMGKLSSSEAEHSADYYHNLREKKAEKREQEAIAQADISYLDFNKVNTYVKSFYATSSITEKRFYQQKIREINQFYGPWLDDYTKKLIRPVLKTLLGSCSH